MVNIHDKPIDICFVAHFAHRAVSGASDGHIGGVERQTNLMARWLASRGHKVSVIVWDEGQGHVVDYDGIRAISVCRRDAGLPGLRFFYPRWTSLNKALREADADVYYHNCAEYVTGQVALWAKQNARRFIYSVASDPDCRPELPTLRSARERVLYRLGLRGADLVISQTRFQARLLSEGFSIGAKVLPMPAEELPESRAATDHHDEGSRVLWIGRLDPVKRVELVIDAAMKCPQMMFDIVGPDGPDASYVRKLRSRAERLDNINWVGPVDFHGVREYYDRSVALLCTSAFEGFPNTFLEAWSCGCPVVSTVDPDDCIAEFGLGRVVQNTDDIARELTDLAKTKNRKDIGDWCRDYFLRRHEKNIAMRRFERAFLALTTEQGKT
jgi:glycosyltransferase involved in cell wall biosynthesis